MATPALEGLLVVDVSGTIATAFCAKQMADYGADVVNLEPQQGFATRHQPPFLTDLETPEASALHAYLNTNKRSVRLQSLTDSQVGTLLQKANLVLDDGNLPAPLYGWRPSSTCVRMSITWYGSNGPYADFIGSDAQIFALNGMLGNIGRAEGPPIIPTGYQAQIVAGMTAYVGALGHVLAAELGNSDAPTHLNTSIYESSLCFTDVGTITYYNTALQSPRLGINRFPPTSPMGVYPCRDGWLGVTVLTPSQWHAFCDLLELPELKDMPLFQTAIGRFDAADIIEPMMCEKLLQHSTEELFYRGQELAIPLARVPTMEQLFDVDQFVERQSFSAASLPDGQTVTVPSVAFRLFANPPRFGGPVAALGAHDADFLP